jgi:D-alanyl-lipoteichoic acid acyltransferase DltB (MBOAT superfamily)
MCWKPEYAILILASTLIDYYAGLKMGSIQEKRKRKKHLYLSLIVNLGLLFSFKYFNFLNDSMRAFFDQFNYFYNVPYFNVLLPIGISFYTFQTISYSIDVYRGQKEPERHLGIFALYVSFFPQLVAGPIERSGRLIPQFYQEHSYDRTSANEGWKIMLWGFFKKVVIADNLAAYVEPIYASPTDFSGAASALATYFFCIQVYCDFSGYADIARGAALVMGFKIFNNFDLPFFSRNFGEFWRKWHISLFSWFKDYIYFSLGGSRVSKARTYLNIFIVFFISGLWHGAAWTYVGFGCLHGFYIIFARLTARLRFKVRSFVGLEKIPAIRDIIGILITFHLFVLSLVFFRANSISDVYLIFTKFLDISFYNPEVFGILSSLDMTVCILSVLFLIAIQLLHIKTGPDFFLPGKPAWFKRPIYISMIVAILVFGKFNAQNFIYFQF